MELEPEDIQALCERKYHQRLQKGRPPFVAVIYPCILGPVIFSLSELIAKAYGSGSASELSKEVRFQVLFYKGPPGQRKQHWTAVDFFLSKEKILYVFLIDAAGDPNVRFIRTMINNIITNNRIISHCYYVEGGIQVDSYNCSYFALDHAIQLSLINPRDFYDYIQQETFPIDDNWDQIPSFRLPLSLLRNMQPWSRIESLKEARADFFEADLCRKPRPAHPSYFFDPSYFSDPSISPNSTPNTIPRTMDDYVIKTLIKDENGIQHYGNTAIEYKKEQFHKHFVEWEQSSLFYQPYVFLEKKLQQAARWDWTTQTYLAQLGIGK